MVSESQLAVQGRRVSVADLILIFEGRDGGSGG